jgi:hypothetical protein
VDVEPGAAAVDVEPGAAAVDAEPGTAAVEAGAANEDVTPAHGIPADTTSRPQPRPRPRPGRADSARQTTTPPAGVGVADSARQTTTPPAGVGVAESARQTATPPGGVGATGFGPTSASGAPAPPHALFTPAASGPVGAGALPGPDGAAPGPEFTIKGNADSMLFHTPESPYFERTRAEVWFRTPDEAVAAGFTEWRAHRRTS